MPKLDDREGAAIGHRSRRLAVAATDDMDGGLRPAIHTKGDGAGPIIVCAIYDECIPQDAADLVVQNRDIMPRRTHGIPLRGRDIDLIGDIDFYRYGIIIVANVIIRSRTPDLRAIQIIFDHGDVLIADRCRLEGDIGAITGLDPDCTGIGAAIRSQRRCRRG